jgi:hypothetical protein
MALQAGLGTGLRILEDLFVGDLVSKVPGVTYLPIEPLHFWHVENHGGLPREHTIAHHALTAEQIRVGHARGNFMYLNEEAVRGLESEDGPVTQTGR